MISQKLTMIPGFGRSEVVMKFTKMDGPPVKCST